MNDTNTQFIDDDGLSKFTSLTHLLVVFSFFEKTTYCCRARRLSVRL